MAHVLIVDDDQDSRESMRFVLEGAGHAVEEAADGTAALQVLRIFPVPCVVVLDLLMPPPDGQAVLEAVLAEGATDPGIRNGKRKAGPLGHAFVVVTAAEHLYPQIGALLVKIPAPLLHKPFNVDVLTALVADAARWQGAR
jgi:CheY-like chemotaxis protein